MDRKPMDVAVFWDLGSCPVSPGPDHGAAAGSSGFEIVDKIRTLASQFGVIKAFKGYIPVRDTGTKPCSSPWPWHALELRSQLHSSGVSLTDVPGKRDVADKMAIVDMLAYALDRAPSETFLVLITAEPSFSYALAFLRLRGYRVILLAPENGETLSLFSQAHSSFRWAQEYASEAEARPTPETRKTFASRASADNPPTGVDLNDYLTKGRGSNQCAKDPVPVPSTPRPLNAGSPVNQSFEPTPTSPELRSHLQSHQGEPLNKQSVQPTSYGASDGMHHDKHDQNPYQRPHHPYVWYESQPNGTFVRHTPQDSTSLPSNDNATGMPMGSSKAQPPVTKADFWVLLDVLRGFEGIGMRNPDRSKVAQVIGQIDRKAFQRVGAATFDEYCVKAERLGLVVLGGAAGKKSKKGNAWVARK